MSTLHTVNKSAAKDALEACLRVASSGDSLVLIEDGVYQASQLVNNPRASSLQLFVLQDDVAARGISVPVTVKRIAYSRLVELVCQHQRSVSWF